MTGRRESATQRLTQLLDASADEATRAHWARYLKGAARFRGVPMAGVRTAVRTVWREFDLADRPTAELLDLSDRWFAAEDSEDKLAAVLLLAEHVAPRLTLHELDRLARPLSDGHVSDWNVCDWYATKALHAFLTAAPDELEERCRALATWGGAQSLWQRRAGLVAFVKLARRGEDVFAGFTALVLETCTASLVSDDRFAHTGPGWVLRELSRAEPGAVRSYVDSHPELSPEARRMATARLRSGPYRRR